MVKNIPVTFQDVFNAPTAEKLALLMESRLSAARDARPSGSAEKAAEEERSDYDGVLCRNTKDNLDNITAENLGKVLVTGATGFLGIHVVKELLDQGYGKIYCLVRRTEVMPKKRLMEIMFYYFGEIDEEAFDSKVIAIEGDITDTGSLEVIKTLDIDTVINCAACVKHFADIDYLKKINVTGVENLANICAEMRARLIQISTVSVAGDYTKDGKGPAVLTEDKLDIGQIVDSNAYVFSKYLAERVMLDAIANKGLDGKIIRVGNLMSRQIDGEFQVNFRTNSFMRILKAYVVLKCFPVDEMDMKDEFSPIDEVAKAITLLAGTDSDFTVFHAYNSHTVDMGDIIFSLRDLGFTINIVDDKTFKKRLERALKDERINSSVSPLVSYNNNDGIETLENDVDNTFTVKALYRLGFRWKITDNEYINKSITMLDELGFFGSALM